jgi:hypothetical protein
MSDRKFRSEPSVAQMLVSIRQIMGEAERETPSSSRAVPMTLAPVTAELVAGNRGLQDIVRD